MKTSEDSITTIEWLKDDTIQESEDSLISWTNQSHRDDG